MNGSSDADTGGETLRDLDESLGRERVLKALLLIGAVIWLAMTQGATHPYVPIVMFMLLVDLMSLNRLRRLVDVLKARDQALSAALDRVTDAGEPDTVDERL